MQDENIGKFYSSIAFHLKFCIQYEIYLFLSSSTDIFLIISSNLREIAKKKKKFVISDEKINATN